MKITDIPASSSSPIRNSRDLAEVEELSEPNSQTMLTVLAFSSVSRSKVLEFRESGQASVAVAEKKNFKPSRNVW